MELDLEYSRPELGMRGTLLIVFCLFLAGCATPQKPVAERRVEKFEALRNPSRAPIQRIRICTFNIQNFGQTKVKNAAVLSQILAIVQAFDVVAIQEVSDKSGKAMADFRKALDPTGQQFEMIVSERTGRHPDDEAAQEQYAYIFRKDRIQLMASAALFPDHEDAFQREPYVARFKVVNGNFTFVLVNIHTQPTRAVAEIGALDSVIQWAKGIYPGEDDFIALGDFNGDCTYAKPAELDGLKLRGPDYIWVVPDDADTNLAQAACAYDRFVMTRGAANDYAGKWEVYRAFTEKNVSDHWPVWAEFFANRDTN